MHGHIRSEGSYFGIFPGISRLERASQHSILLPSLECLGVICMVNSGYVQYNLVYLFACE